MIWLIGSDGMLGQCVHELLASRGAPFAASDREVDITDLAAVARFAERRPIAAMINCAAFTDVRACEARREDAFRVNADGVRNLAAVAAATGAHLLHVSTDYVFDGGAREPYREDAPTNPLNVYGKSKLAGEEALRSSSCRWTIARTAWLFGEAGPNFVATVLRRLRAAGSMRVVDDQFGTPTYAPDLAEALLALIGAEPGIYHFANTGTTSRFAYAQEIARAATAAGFFSSMPDIEAASTREFDDGVVRPAFSALATDKISAALKARPRPWKDGVGEFLRNVFTRTVAPEVER